MGSDLIPRPPAPVVVYPSQGLRDSVATPCVKSLGSARQITLRYQHVAFWHGRCQRWNATSTPKTFPIQARHNRHYVYLPQGVVYPAKGGAPFALFNTLCECSPVRPLGAPNKDLVDYIKTKAAVKEEIDPLKPPSYFHLYSFLLIYGRPGSAPSFFTYLWTSRKFPSL
jgi:hypothetical protein